jgi:ribosomal protein S18 acetylase RimI-like enzyme
LSASVLSLRIAGPDDREAVVGLHTRSWQTAYADTLDPDWLADGCEAHMRAKWEPRLVDPELFRVELADDADGNTVGFSCVEVTESGPFLDNLHVEPGLRRSGVGSTLIDSIFARLRAEGDQSFELEVFENNDAARALYERFGGRVVRSFDEHGPEGSTIPAVRYRFDVS